MIPGNKQARRYAFVGSRDYPESAYVHIQQAINVLPSSHTVVCSGGAPGVDTIAVKYAKARGIATEVISAKEQGEFSSHRAFQRNEEIIRSSDEVFAFWDGQSNGTRHAIRVAQEHQKRVTAVLPSGVSFAPAYVLALSKGPIVYASGDMLQSNADAIINPCNTQGVYGAGLSKALSVKWPWWTSDYKTACKSQSLRVGSLHLSHPPAHVSNNPVIIHFPTKDHWKNPSEMEYVDGGLAYLAAHYKEWGVRSIAMPKLGGGLGGLQWGRVKLHIESFLEELSGIHFIVYI